MKRPAANYQCARCGYEVPEQRRVHFIMMPRHDTVLTRWELTARELSDVRRNRPAAEARTERKLANIERLIVSMLYKEHFGHRIGVPKLARSYARRKNIT